MNILLYNLNFQIEDDEVRKLETILKLTNERQTSEI